MMYQYQALGDLRKFAKSQKVPNYEILSAQYLSLFEKSKFFSSHSKVKIGCLWQPGVSRAQQ